MDISEVDEMTKIWLGNWFRNITSMEESEIDVNIVRQPLDEEIGGETPS